ncbi:Uncharacterised protein [Bordetella pertussis]|nr:Uncharacterised protein [Bordetella pertussis]
MATKQPEKTQLVSTLSGFWRVMHQRGAYATRRALLWRMRARPGCPPPCGAGAAGTKKHGMEFA